MRLFVPEITHKCKTFKMHVAASVLVNTVANGLGEGKQLIKKMDSILVHSSLMFLRLSVSWKLIKQQNTEINLFCSFKRLVNFQIKMSL